MEPGTLIMTSVKVTATCHSHSAPQTDLFTGWHQTGCCGYCKSVQTTNWYSTRHPFNLVVVAMCGIQICAG